MNASPIDRDADKLLAEHPSSEYPFLSSSQLYRISKHEVCIDPQYIPYANSVLDKSERYDDLAYRERERKRKAKTVRRGRVGTKAGIKKKVGVIA